VLRSFKELAREDVKQEVERQLTGRETEAWWIVYFKRYKSRVPVEKALETVGLMLGTDESIIDWRWSAGNFLMERTRCSRCKPKGADRVYALLSIFGF